MVERIATTTECRAGGGETIRPRPADRIPRYPHGWAKSRDAETLAAAEAIGDACRRAHRLGLTDADLAALASRPGRLVNIWTLRAWREAHRSHSAQFADVVRLAAALPEQAARPLVDLMAGAAGMVACDLPEPGAGADTLERASMDVARESGELVGVVLAATADGVLDELERQAIGREAREVARSAVWCGRSAEGREGVAP